MPGTEPAAADDASAPAIRAGRWLRDQAAPVRRLIGIAIACGTAQSIVACLTAWLVADVLGAAIFGHRGFPSLHPALLAIVVLALLRGLLFLRQRTAADAAGRQVVRAAHRDLQQRLRQLGPAWCMRQSHGDLVTRLVDGVDTLAPYYAGYLPQMALAVIVPAIVLVAVLLAEPWSALVLAVCAPLVPVFMILAGRAAAEASQRRWLRLRRLGARFMDAVAGLATLRLYRAAGREQARLAAVGDAYRRETMAVLRVAFLSALVMEFFATMSIAVVAVLVGFRLMDGKLAFVPGMFALMLAPEFFLPLRAMGTQRHARMEAAAAAEGLLDVLEAQPTAAPRAAGGAVPPATPPAIRFDGVCAGHDDRRDVLSGIDLAIPAGTRLTLVGASGGGKSSLLALLMGFLSPRAGRIAIDGVDLAALDLDAWRQRLMWLSQRPHVFAGSLRDNLRIARPDADEVAIARAVRLAVLEPVIARLPRGLDTQLGERGLGLSGGEVQRLALARAWLRDAPVLLLDEPTQHLDAGTAAIVERALDQLGQGRTVLRAAHRVDALPDDERIAVLDAGRIVETGLAGELRRQSGAFAALLREDRRA